MRKAYLAIVALALVAALPLAVNAGASSRKGATIKVGKAGGLGQVIVSARGMTLYNFHKDKGKTSSCYGACAENWPPLLTKGAPTAAGGAKSSLLGTTKRKDGSTQVTYNGHPLYYFKQDTAAGDTNGQGQNLNGGLWWIVSSAGAPITGAAPSQSSSGGGGGGWS